MKTLAVILLGLVCLQPAWCQDKVGRPAYRGKVELRQSQSDHVTIKLMFRVGSIHDPLNKKGLTALTANMVANGGTKDLTKSDIDALLYPLAVNFDVSVDKEATVFSTTIHEDNLSKAYPVFRDLFLEPRWDRADFDRLKKAQLKTIQQGIPENNDEVFSKRALDLLMFEDHPYQHLVEGTVEGVENIDLQDVITHFRLYFTRANLTIGVAGGFRRSFPDDIQRDLRRLPEGTANQVTLPKVEMPDGIEALVVAKPRAFGTAVFMGYPMDLDRSDADFAALMVANSFLGEHRKSYGVLYNRMRATRSLNYGDYSYIEWYPAGHATQLPFTGTPRRQNFFSIWIRPVQLASAFADGEDNTTPPLGNGHFAIRLALWELKKLVEQGMTAEDFQRTRQFLMGYLRLYVQSPQARLGFLMDGRYYGHEDYIETTITRLENLSLQDVNKAIRKYLQPDNFYLAVITDQSEAQQLAESLKSNASAPIHYSSVVANGLPEAVKQEDQQIDAFKLNVTDVKVVSPDSLFQK